MTRQSLPVVLLSATSAIALSVAGCSKKVEAIPEAFITTAGARTASPSYGALGVVKGMAESLMRYLVPEFAPRGIRINAVAP